MRKLNDDLQKYVYKDLLQMTKNPPVSYLYLGGLVYPTEISHANHSLSRSLFLIAPTHHLSNRFVAREDTVNEEDDRPVIINMPKDYTRPH